MGPRPPAPLNTGSTSGEEMVDEITFTEPPARIRYDWAAIADQVRERPMSWALVFTQDRTSVVNAIRMGGIAAVHPDLGFETLTTNNVREPIRKCDLYIRWNPDKVNATAEMLAQSRKGEVE